ncbi:PREDICTED: uncharacterized protein LOC109222749 [Nicotiana attenuata]|uniref:uncharacterized protein LOC109222749 n=1 Tax=Nicotiana attenuata TaxID=49451 RepID=UPI000905819A|nr:PREDICTED: uncharacterized protein LOC109222749 [Nicotiana attenuata]
MVAPYLCLCDHSLHPHATMLVRMVVRHPWLHLHLHHHPLLVFLGHMLEALPCRHPHPLIHLHLLLKIHRLRLLKRLYHMMIITDCLSFLMVLLGLFPLMNLRKWLWIVLKHFTEMLGVNGQIYRIFTEIRCGINLGQGVHGIPNIISK